MKEMPTVFLNDPVFFKLGDMSRLAVLDKSESRDDERSLKLYRDNYAIAKTGRSEGFVEGKAECIAQGESKLIKRMFRHGKTVSEISDMTGYTPD